MSNTTPSTESAKVMLPGMVAQYSRDGLPHLHDLFLNTKEGQVFRWGDCAVDLFKKALDENPKKALQILLWLGDNNARGDRANMNPIMPEHLKRVGFTDEQRAMMKGGPLKRKVHHALLCYLWDNHRGLILDNLEIFARNACLKELLKLLTYAVYGAGMHKDAKNPAFAGSDAAATERLARKEEVHREEYGSMQRHQEQGARRLELCIAFLKHEYGDNARDWEKDLAVFMRRANYPKLFSWSEQEARDACEEELRQIRALYSDYQEMVKKLAVFGTLTLKTLDHSRIFNAASGWRDLLVDGSQHAETADFREIEKHHERYRALKKGLMFFQMPVLNIREAIFSADEDPLKVKEICEKRYQMFMANTRLADLLMPRPFPRRQSKTATPSTPTTAVPAFAEPDQTAKDPSEERKVCYVLRPIPDTELTRKYHAWIEVQQRKQKEELVRRRRAVREERLECMSAALEDTGVNELFDRVSRIFATLIKADLANNELGKPFGGLAPKWAPTPKNRFDKLLPGEAGIVRRICTKLGVDRYGDMLKGLRKGWPETANLNEPGLDMSRFRWTSNNLERCMKQSSNRTLARGALEAMVNEKSIQRAKVEAQIKEELAAGKDADALKRLLDKYSVKVTGILPHDVVKKAVKGKNSALLNLQWAEFCRGVREGRSADDFAFIIPMVDVSPSMSDGQAIYAAIAIGLLLAACPGPTQGLMITFSETPEMVNIDVMIREAGDVPELGMPGHLERVVALVQGLKWGRSTNLVEAYKLAMSHASRMDVSQRDMENSTMVVLSDMELNENDRGCDQPFATSYERIKKMSDEFGFKGTTPRMVFWDLSDRAQRSTVAPPDAENVINLSGLSGALVELVLKGCDRKELEKEKHLIGSGGGTEKLIRDSVYQNPAYEGLDTKGFCPRVAWVEEVP